MPKKKPISWFDVSSPVNGFNRFCLIIIAVQLMRRLISYNMLKCSHYFISYLLIYPFYQSEHWTVLLSVEDKDIDCFMYALHQGRRRKWIDTHTKESLAMCTAIRPIILVSQEFNHCEGSLGNLRTIYVEKIYSLICCILSIVYMLYKVCLCKKCEKNGFNWVNKAPF